MHKLRKTRDALGLKSPLAHPLSNEKFSLKNEKLLTCSHVLIQGQLQVAVAVLDLLEDSKYQQILLNLVHKNFFIVF